MGKWGLFDLVTSLAESHKEGEWWDFKKKWPSNADLLYDILCLANNTQFHDAYLIIGVDEEDDYALSGVPKGDSRKNTQMVVDFLRSQPFAGDNVPSVQVTALPLPEGGTVDVVSIDARKDAPYYLGKSGYGIHAGSICTRTLDSNTPKGESANYRQVEALWRNHFGLMDVPFERLKAFLADKDGWEDSPEHTEGEKEFYTLYPEYTIEHVSDDWRDGQEYYHHEQTDPEPHWYEIFARYHQTVIWGASGIALDGGRYFTSAPDRTFISTPSHNSLSAEDLSYLYCFYVKGSINHLMHEHLYKAGTDDERISRDRFL